MKIIFDKLLAHNSVLLDVSAISSVSLENENAYLLVTAAFLPALCYS